MKVLLVETTSHRYRDNPLSQMDRVLEPLAIECIGAHIRSVRPHHDVELLQQRELETDALVERILSAEPDVLGLSCMTYSFSETSEVARRVKAHSPKTSTVLGGYHALGMESADSWFDFVVRGEGEPAMTTILDLLERRPGSDAAGVPGLVFHHGVRVRAPLRRLTASEFVRPLRLPREPFKSLSMGENLPDTRLACVIAGRGCPYRCDFCCTPLVFHGKRVLRSVSEVVDEIAALQAEHGVNTVNLRDETFTPDKKYVNDFCRELIRRNVKVSWRAFAYVGNCDKAMLSLMAEAGCHMLFYGIEASDSDTLHARRKRFPSMARIAEDVRNAQAAGIFVRGGFIVGHPSDTEGSFARHLEFLKGVCPDELYVSFLTPFPGTPLHEQMKSDGRLLPLEFADYDCEHPAIDIGIPSERLVELRQELYRGFYASAQWRGHIARRMRSGRERASVLSFAGHVSRKFGLDFQADARKSRA